MFWEQRHASVNTFEKRGKDSETLSSKFYLHDIYLHQFYLHLSTEVQSPRLIASIDDPQKNRMFRLSDIQERQFWDAYACAYERAIGTTSPDAAPCDVIPAGDKHLCIQTLSKNNGLHIRRQKAADLTHTYSH